MKASRGRLQAQQLLPKDPGLDTADAEFLIVAQKDGERAAGNRHDPADHIDIDDDAAAKPDETSRFKASRQISEPMANGMGFIIGCAQIK